MMQLSATPTLADFQKYVADMKAERGFNTTDAVYECLLLGEEVGELFKAVRKNRKGSHIETGSTAGDIEEELADIFIFLCGIANISGIDLETAFRNKEEVNKQRQWQKVS